MGCAPSLPTLQPTGIVRCRHSSTLSTLRDNNVNNIQILQTSTSVAGTNDERIKKNEDVTNCIQVSDQTAGGDEENSGKNDDLTARSNAPSLPTLLPQQFLQQLAERRFSQLPGNGHYFSSSTAPPVQLLLYFPREDAQSDAWQWASRKLGHQVHLAKTHEAAMQVYHTHHPSLLVIDRRLGSRSSEADALCRSVRTAPGGQYVTVLAVVRRSTLEREESLVLPLLNLGYDRCFPESGSLGACLNELLTLEATDLSLRRQLRLTEAILAALNVTRQLVTILDTHGGIEYVNSASEQLLGFGREDLQGGNFGELHRTDGGKLDVAQVLDKALKSGKNWEGTCFCKRKTGDTVPLYSRLHLVHSLQCPETVDHVVLLQDPPPLLTDKSWSGDIGVADLYPMPRGSLRSARKASYDVRSLGSDTNDGKENFSYRWQQYTALLRRQSLARLQSMAMEAPITKVIHLISAAQESSPFYISQALDKVLEILRSAELYMPQFHDSRVKADDPVTIDLLGALLSQGPKLSNTRRSSSESTSKLAHPAMFSRSLLPHFSNINVPIQIREMLENDVSWDFDVIRLEKLTGHRPLVWLGMSILTRFEVQRTLGCDEATLQNWLTLIEANYHGSNSYHNSTHAADVLQATAYFLERNRVKQLLDPVDEATCLIAAIAHDIDHPGRTSGFLCNSNAELAVLYNDLSVLESHHSALLFKLTLHDDRVNIFKGLERDMYKVIRQNIVDMILATEMTKHFEHLSKFINVFAKPYAREEDESNLEVDISLLATPENVNLVKRMLIKCADVCNPTRPLSLCVEWARRIAEEYFSQTEEEKMKGLTVVMPQFDRATCSIPKSQIGFTDYFINDMFDAWDSFAEIPDLLVHLRRNYQFWKEQDQKGVTGIPPEFSPSSPSSELALTPSHRDFETLTEAREESQKSESSS